MSKSAQSQLEDPQDNAASNQVFFTGRGVARFPTIDKAKGVHLWDTDGKRYFDGSSGAVVSNIGHGNEHVIAAMNAQAEKCSYVLRTVFVAESSVTFTKLVTDLAGPPFDQAFMVSGGSEAIEAAIKLARQYAYARGETKRWKVLSRMPSYHGSTAGAAQISGIPEREEVFGPIMRIMPKVPAPFTYRTPENHDADSYGRACAAKLEETIQSEGPESVLAFVMEPVGGGTTGGLVAPDDYYAAVREICDRHGVLLIFDEIMSGSGRTGKFLAAHHWPNALPDIVALAKGLGAGYTPLGAILAPNHIVDAVVSSGGFLHGHTYAGNPLSSAVGTAVLEELIRLDLMKNAEVMGNELRRRLKELMEDSTVIGDVRGLGLLNGVEIVSNRSTKEMFADETQTIYRIMEIGRERGLLMYARRWSGGQFGEWVLAAPPLITNEAQLDEYVGLFADTINAFELEIGRK